MATIQATFDGRVFVPCQPIDLPAGTLVGVVLPDRPQQPTEEEQHPCERIRQQLAASAPYFPTVKEAVRYSRKRP